MLDEKMKDPVIEFKYTNEWGNVTTMTADLTEMDGWPLLEQLFSDFSRFLIACGWSPDTIKEYYPEL